MTEAQFTRRLVKALRERAATWPLIWKVNDRITPGIPDLHAVDPWGDGWYWEVKIARTEAEWADPSICLSAHQARRLAALQQAVKYRAGIIVRSSRADVVQLLTPFGREVLGDTPERSARTLVSLVGAYHDTSR